MLYALVLLLLFAAYIVIKTLLFVPKKREKTEPISTKIDYDKAINNFSEIIKAKTISRVNGEGEDEDEFSKLINSLPNLFPNVYEKLEFQKIGRRGLLYRWKGKDSSKASVLMAHYDVVPVEESRWTEKPFGAEIKDGMLYGRGTLDTKGTFTAVLHTADTLIKEGYVPKEDIYLAFSGEEEIHGESANDIAQKLRKDGVEITMVLDEGGAVVEHIFAKDAGRIAVVGIAEKGAMNLELVIEGDGGHASAPPAKGLVGRLAKAIQNIENKPMKVKMNSVFKALIDTIGRQAGFGIRIIFANINIFKPLIALIARKKGGELNAMLRTSFAFTKLSGSNAMNVMPAKVSLGMNIRTLEQDKKEDILQHIKKVSKCEQLQLNVQHFQEASPCSRTDIEPWNILKRTIEMTWQDAAVTPYLMVAASDSRHYSKFSDRVYRFSAMELTKNERGLIHGNDERIRLDEWKNTLDFYYRLIKQI